MPDLELADRRQDQGAETVAPPEPRPRRTLGCAGALLGMLLIAALVFTFVFYRLENLSYNWAGEVRNAFAAVAIGLRPRVTVNEQVVYEQAGPVMELAVLEREIVVERNTADTWLGSTKHLRIRGIYRVKAGFDLKQSVTAQIEGAQAQTVRVNLPRPKLLSVELERIETLAIDNGFWNRVQPEEYQDEVNALNLDARSKAWTAGLPAEAEKMFAEQLQQKLGPAHHLEVTTGTSAAVQTRK